MPETIFETEAPYFAEVTVYHSEDWTDPLPQFLDPFTGDPLDLTGKTLTIYMRPTYDYEEPLLIATSAGSAGILIDDAADGLASMFVARSDVQDIPAGDWQQFLNLDWTDGGLGAVTKTIWRGPFLVRPGRTS